MSRKGQKKDSRRALKTSHPANRADLGTERAVLLWSKDGLFPPSPRRRAVLAVCGFLLLAVALVFGQTLRHELINSDDDQYVYRNPHVARGFTAQRIAWAFTQFHAANWHPLTWLSHMLDCQLYGLNHPGGHHLTNVLLHAASAILLFLLLRQTIGSLWRSAFVAALFAVHPLHVESVAWVAERKDVLSGLFFMLTLAAYTGYARRPFSLLRYLLVTLLLVLGLMAKPMLVTLPFLLLLLDYWPLGRWQGAGSGGAPTAFFPVAGAAGLPFWRLLAEKLPFMALAAVSCVLTYFAQETSGAICQRLPLTARIANALVSSVAYLRQFVYPVGLAAIYPYSQDSLAAWKIIGSGLLLAGISLAALVCRRKCPFLLVGWLWYLGMLVPVIGLVQVGSQAMADRYTYLPQIGPYIALTWGIERVSRGWPYRRRLAGAAAALVVAVLAWCAWRQVSYWKDDETLWRHTLACTSKNWLAHNNLGAALAGRGQIDAAIDHYQQSLEIAPNYDLAHNNLGAALAGRGETDAAIDQYQQALKINPQNAMARDNLAMALLGRGQADKAMVHYEQALKIDPDDAAAHYNLGNLLAGRGQVDAAIEHYQEALKIKPDYAEAHGNLGIALAGLGQLDAAIDHYQQALKIRPDDAEDHYNLGLALSHRGQVDAAVTQYQEALQIKPDYAAAHYNLGMLLANRRQVDEAIAHYQKALEIRPDYAECHGNLGNALAAQGKLDEAIQHYRAVLRLNPQDVPGHIQLGNTLARQGRVPEAEAQFHEALRLHPDQPDALMRIAWLRATHPDPRFRDAAQAVALARRAAQLAPGDADALDTLAAAYAESNRFAEAVETATAASRLATAAGRPDLAAEIQQRIDLYRNSKPYRQSP